MPRMICRGRVVPGALLALALCLPPAGRAWGGTLSAISYEMRDGDVTYLDDTYPPLPAAEGRLLSGSTGQLTDGAVGPALQFTDLRWVGWRWADPVNIVFDFGSPQHFDRFGAHIFHNSFQGIKPPDNVTLSFSNDKSSWWGDFSQLPAPLPAEGGDAGWGYIPMNQDARWVRASFDRAENYWLFLSEVQFEGSPLGPAIPEPSTWLLFGLGALAVVAWRRRRP